jgi:dTDP-4-amino-4,6-dideoxygalactose transaminase
MLVTDDDELADRARGLRDYGKPDPWVSFHTEVASNWRMVEFCAAIGVVHHKRLDEFIAWREGIASRYTTALRDVPGMAPVLPSERSSWYKYIVLLPHGVDRERLKKVLKEQGVSLGGGVYDTPLHRQPVFSNLAKGQFPVADDIAVRHICLPLYYGMNEEAAWYVVNALKDALE